MRVRGGKKCSFFEKFDVLRFLETPVLRFALCSDDTTAYRISSKLTITWFEKNYTKLKIDECHLIVSGTKYEKVRVKLGKGKIWECNNVTLLGVKIDTKLKFDEDISKICLKANRKLTHLRPMFPFYTP